MRPPRIAILVLFFAASLFLFCRSVVSLRSTQPVVPLSPHGAVSPFRSFLSFTTPFTLFPPNAAISLTDDNSTFFPARPAAFGPPIPQNGLSGQLWIGSGFADENLPEGEGEGELGCSDLPGWGDGSTIIGLTGTMIGLSAKAKAAPAADKDKISKRSKLPQGPPVDVADDAEVINPPTATEPLDDGTDDYLHRGLSGKTGLGYEMTTITSSHADIQSMQETAEITGKVVLLSRGGCGFLEKVKWAQRRGAVGLIVGDNQKGGPLIQMFARGDTSNVTIPAIFTSRTTAHLLSSLMHPGSFIEDLTVENGNSAFKVQQADKARKSKKTVSSPKPVTQEAAAKLTAGQGTTKSKVTRKESSTQTTKAEAKEPGWLSRILGLGGPSNAAADRSRPPSSGQHDWVLVDDWSDEKDKVIRSTIEKAAKKTASSYNQVISGDGFQIGVQDWRDPDLVDAPSINADKSATAGHDAGALGKSLQGSPKTKADKSSKASVKETDVSKDLNGPKGGSITPGSGQYVPQSSKGKPALQNSGSHESGSGGLISKLFGDDDSVDTATPHAPPKAINTPLTKQPEPTPPVHEGLWVTITPTGSTAPFFDTLLVLVVSPLITLTVVYALLILRAKLRRRRWRAPKSVVERLPVRTYHTVPSSHSSRQPSPTSTSPTTPLLQGSSRPRPRSRTTTGVPEVGDLLRPGSSLQSSRAPSRADEKKPSEWKKYMGRQVECVVCLEEYVDGVSRVMSLPCGHEFHAECITPWLTTRRRTCPICKGDVVRSLARGQSASPRYEPYQDDSDAEQPIPSGSGRRTPEPDADLERGIVAPVPRPAPRRPGRPDRWLALLSTSFNSVASASSSRSQPAEEDRTR